MDAGSLYDDITKCFEEVESGILESEECSGTGDCLSQVLDALGIAARRLPCPVSVMLLDLLDDGIITPGPNFVDAMLVLLDAQKRLYFELIAAATGQRYEDHVAARHAAPPSSEDAPDIPPLPDAAVSEERESSPPNAPAAAPAVAPPEASAAGEPAKTPQTDPPHAHKDKESATVKVSTEKLDLLMESLKELVITHTMLAQNKTMQDERNKELFNTVQDNGRTIDTLRRHILDIRKVSLRPTFTRMGRLIRDLAHQTGKKVNFVYTGEDVELDKTLVDELGDPLIHLLRNSVDHGIEAPEDRIMEGKDGTGTVRLNAWREDDNVIIEILDDGKGLDVQRILEKARSRGLCGPEETPPEEKIFGFIMHAGFSTAQAVTNLSGRGVGMDVVAQAIRSLDGNIDISSRAGEGSRFVITLPSNRSATEGIADGIVVRVGPDYYVVPRDAVLEVLQPQPGDIGTVAGAGEVIGVRGENHAMFRLCNIFGTQASVSDPTSGHVVLLEVNRERKAIMVDDVLGEQQVVVRGFSTFKDMFGIDLFSGVALIGDQAGIVIDLERFFLETDRSGGNGQRRSV